MVAGTLNKGDEKGIKCGELNEIEKTQKEDSVGNFACVWTARRDVLKECMSYGILFASLPALLLLYYYCHSSCDVIAATLCRRSDVPPENDRRTPENFFPVVSLVRGLLMQGVKSHPYSVFKRLKIPLVSQGELLERERK
jgi:hypothetical protein